jgi:hypothetical protein
LKTSAAEPKTWATVWKGSQLVGFRVKSGRLAKTRRSLTFSGMPSRMWGIGSEAAPSTSTWALEGFRFRPTRVTIVPTSKGPATAGTIAATLKGAPL